MTNEQLLSSFHDPHAVTPKSLGLRTSPQNSIHSDSYSQSTLLAVTFHLTLAFTKSFTTRSSPLLAVTQVSSFFQVLNEQFGPSLLDFPPNCVMSISTRIGSARKSQTTHIHEMGALGTGSGRWIYHITTYSAAHRLRQVTRSSQQELGIHIDTKRRS